MFHISIHALAKRATKVWKKKRHFETISIHALAKRATFIACVNCLFRKYFNPRPRKEGDSFVFAIAKVPCDFNPRPRKEGDSMAMIDKSLPEISIHALAKRATISASRSKRSACDFNPRPRKEGDQEMNLYQPTIKHFNPRPRKEGDGGAQKRKLRRYYFNPRPRKEGDQCTRGRFYNL